MDDPGYPRLVLAKPWLAITLVRLAGIGPGWPWPCPDGTLALAGIGKNLCTGPGLPWCGNGPCWPGSGWSVTLDSPYTYYDKRCYLQLTSEVRLTAGHQMLNSSFLAKQFSHVTSVIRKLGVGQQYCYRVWLVETNRMMYHMTSKVQVENLTSGQGHRVA